MPNFLDFVLGMRRKSNMVLGPMTNPAPPPGAGKGFWLYTQAHSKKKWVDNPDTPAAASPQAPTNSWSAPSGDGAFDESKHPRGSKGTPEGGKFTSGAGGAAASPSAAPAALASAEDKFLSGSKPAAAVVAPKAVPAPSGQSAEDKFLGAAKPAVAFQSANPADLSKLLIAESDRLQAQIGTKPKPLQRTGFKDIAPASTFIDWMVGIKAVSATPTSVYAHGPGGLFSAPGLSGRVVSATVSPRGWRKRKRTQKESFDYLQQSLATALKAFEESKHPRAGKGDPKGGEFTAGSGGGGVTTVTAPTPSTVMQPKVVSAAPSSAGDQLRAMAETLQKGATPEQKFVASAPPTKPAAPKTPSPKEAGKAAVAAMPPPHALQPNEYSPAQRAAGGSDPLTTNYQGWRLHLATDDPQGVSQQLTEMKLNHKLGTTFDETPNLDSKKSGIDITVYAGSRADAEKTAADIQTKVGGKLKSPSADLASMDQPFTPLVHGNFSLGTSRNYGYTSSTLHGIPQLRDDQDSPKEGVDPHAHAHQSLQDKFGEFYSGVKSAPKKESPKSAAADEGDANITSDKPRPADKWHPAEKKPFAPIAPTKAETEGTKPPLPHGAYAKPVSIDPAKLDQFKAAGAPVAEAADALGHSLLDQNKGAEVSAQSKGEAVDQAKWLAAFAADLRNGDMQDAAAGWAQLNEANQNHSVFDTIRDYMNGLIVQKNKERAYLRVKELAAKAWDEHKHKRGGKGELHGGEFVSRFTGRVVSPDPLTGNIPSTPVGPPNPNLMGDFVSRFTGRTVSDQTSVADRFEVIKTPTGKTAIRDNETQAIVKNLGFGGGSIARTQAWAINHAHQQGKAAEVEEELAYWRKTL